MPKRELSLLINIFLGLKWELPTPKDGDVYMAHQGEISTCTMKGTPNHLYIVSLSKLLLLLSFPPIEKSHFTIIFQTSDRTARTIYAQLTCKTLDEIPIVIDIDEIPASKLLAYQHEKRMWVYYRSRIHRGRIYIFASLSVVRISSRFPVQRAGQAWKERVCNEKLFHFRFSFPILSVSTCFLHHPRGNKAGETFLFNGQFVTGCEVAKNKMDGEE